MKINLKLLFCPGFLLLLMVSQSQARAKPISSLQRMSELLDEDLEHPLVSEDRDHEQDNIIPRGAFDQQDTESQWTRNTRDQPEGMSMGDSAVQRFFSDLRNSPRLTEISKDLLPFREIFSPYSHRLHQPTYYTMY